MTKRSHKKQIFQDVLYILLSVLVAYIAIRIGFVGELVGYFNGCSAGGIFLAGLFFTSVFTTVPAMVLLSAFASNSDLVTVVLVGALGAAIGDYLIFHFIRDRVALDVEYILRATHKEKLKLIFHKRIFRWFVPLIGAIIIASPLPDELGIAMLGISKTKSRNFIFISYIFNVIGIMIIALVVTSTGVSDKIMEPEPVAPSVIEAVSSAEIVHGDTSKRQVIFTFDGGSGVQSGTEILEVLAKHRVKGTFFLTGKFIDENIDFVRSIAGSGGEIFNHTYDHPYLTTLTDAEIVAELNKMNDVLISTLASTTSSTTTFKSLDNSNTTSVDDSTKITSAKPFFRAPYGDRDERVREVAAKNGYQDVYWTVDARDWEESTGETDVGVTDRIIANLKPGNIFLMHIGDRITGRILDRVFTTIENRGYKIVSLTQGL